MRGYGLCNVLCAVLYSGLGFALWPSRSSVFNVALGGVVLLLGLSGVGLLTGRRWARRVALVSCLVQLVFAAAVIVLLVASWAYLRGIYGPLGRGIAILALVAAALSIELFALVPLFELAALLRGRRSPG